MMTSAALGGQCFVSVVFHCSCPHPSLFSSSLLSFTCHDRRHSFPRLQARVPCVKALRVVACAGLTNSENDCLSDGQEPLSQETAFDIKLPRRSLLVQFTCNACGERTERLINRTAYEKGTVFLQCAGCLVYHKFVDNLGLVVEYDLRDELDTNSGVTN